MRGVHDSVATPLRSIKLVTLAVRPPPTIMRFRYWRITLLAFDPVSGCQVLFNVVAFGADVDVYLAGTSMTLAAGAPQITC